MNKTNKDSSADNETDISLSPTPHPEREKRKRKKTARLVEEDYVNEDKDSPVKKAKVLPNKAKPIIKQPKKSELSKSPKLNRTGDSRPNSPRSSSPRSRASSPRSPRSPRSKSPKAAEVVNAPSHESTAQQKLQQQQQQQQQISDSLDTEKDKENDSNVEVDTQPSKEKKPKKAKSSKGENKSDKKKDKTPKRKKNKETSSGDKPSKPRTKKSKPKDKSEDKKSSEEQKQSTAEKTDETNKVSKSENESVTDSSGKMDEKDNSKIAVSDGKGEKQLKPKSKSKKKDKKKSEKDESKEEKKSKKKKQSKKAETKEKEVKENGKDKIEKPKKTKKKSKRDSSKNMKADKIKEQMSSKEGNIEMNGESECGEKRAETAVDTIEEIINKVANPDGSHSPPCNSETEVPDSRTVAVCASRDTEPLCESGEEGRPGENSSLAKLGSMVSSISTASNNVVLPSSTGSMNNSGNSSENELNKKSMDVYDMIDEEDELVLPPRPSASITDKVGSMSPRSPRIPSKDSSDGGRCEKCGLILPTSVKLAKHVERCGGSGTPQKVEAEELKHKCQECPYASKWKFLLRRHLCTHGIYSCQHCSHTSGSQKDLETHVKEIHPKKPKQKCSTCSQFVHASEDYEEHIRTCTGKIKYICPICQKEFKYFSVLENHKARHSAEMPYACDKCDFKATRKDNLNKHCRTVHEEKKPVQCPQCGKSISSEHNLKRHLRTHIGDDRPFQCDKCQKYFKTENYLRMHQDVQHNPASIHCPVVGCKKMFKTQKTLKHHQQEFHDPDGKRYPCTHPGCDLVFVKRSHLKRHEATHTGERRFKCDWPDCGKAFRHADNLKVHYRQHTNEKPFGCEECDFACRQKSSLQWHMKRHHGDLPPPEPKKSKTDKPTRKKKVGEKKGKKGEEDQEEEKIVEGEVDGEVSKEESKEVIKEESKEESKEEDRTEDKAKVKKKVVKTPTKKKGKAKKKEVEVKEPVEEKVSEKKKGKRKIVAKTKTADKTEKPEKKPRVRKPRVSKAKKKKEEEEEEEKAKAEEEKKVKEAEEKEEAKGEDSDDTIIAASIQETIEEVKDVAPPVEEESMDVQEEKEVEDKEKTEEGKEEGKEEDNSTPENAYIHDGVLESPISDEEEEVPELQLPPRPQDSPTLGAYHASAEESSQASSQEVLEKEESMQLLPPPPPPPPPEDDQDLKDALPDMQDVIDSDMYDNQNHLDGLTSEPSITRAEVSVIMSQSQIRECDEERLANGEIAEYDHMAKSVADSTHQMLMDDISYRNALSEAERLSRQPDATDSEGQSSVPHSIASMVRDAIPDVPPPDYPMERQTSNQRPEPYSPQDRNDMPPPLNSPPEQKVYTDNNGSIVDLSRAAMDLSRLPPEDSGMYRQPMDTNASAERSLYSLEQMAAQTESGDPNVVSRMPSTPAQSSHSSSVSRDTSHSTYSGKDTMPSVASQYPTLPTMMSRETEYHRQVPGMPPLPSRGQDGSLFPSSTGDFYGQFMPDCSALPPQTLADDRYSTPTSQQTLSQRPASVVPQSQASGFQVLQQNEFLRRTAYGSPDLLNAGSQGTQQAAHWIRQDERARAWAQSSPLALTPDLSTNSPLSKDPFPPLYEKDYNQQLGKSATSFGVPPPPRDTSTDPMSHHLDMASMYMGRHFNPAAAAAAAANSNYQRHVTTSASAPKPYDETYRHVPDYRTLSQTAAPTPDMFGRMAMNAPPPPIGLEKYYYPRDPMYRTQHLSTPTPPFMSQPGGAQVPAYAERDYARNAAMYAQANPYTFMGPPPPDKQDLTGARKIVQSMPTLGERDYFTGAPTPHPPNPAQDPHFQDPYRRSVIYNMMNRYF